MVAMGQGLDDRPSCGVWCGPGRPEDAGLTRLAGTNGEGAGKVANLPSQETARSLT